VPIPLSAENITVLVVDDEKNIVPLICEKLALAGFKALGAVGPREAIRECMLHEGSIDLLLTDVVMPSMNGRELANRIAAARPGIKVLFMSAYSDQILYSHGVVPQGVSLIRKPFRLDDLVVKIQDVLQAGAVWKVEAAR
jgi:two-component system cell cycle sensor histidine kinase/response regulator CckA